MPSEKQAYVVKLCTSYQQQSQQYQFVNGKETRIADYYFKSLHDFLYWFEATTHRIFQVCQLSEENIKTLQEKYLSDIYIFRDETLKVSLKYSSYE